MVSGCTRKQQQNILRTREFYDVCAKMCMQSLGPSYIESV